MVKEKTSALERAKKAAVQGKGKKSARGGSSSRTALPKDWIQGDWMPSAIRQDDLDDLVEGGFIPHESARLPGKEVEPLAVQGMVSASSSPPISIVDSLCLLILFSGAS